VRRIIADQTGLRVEELEPTRPLEDLGIDSLLVIESMFVIENEFKVQMPDGQMPIRTVQDIADLVDQLVRERDAAKAGSTQR